MKILDKLAEWFRGPLNGEYFDCPECDSNDAVRLLGERDKAICRQCLYQFYV